ncbi:hypothetical protein [Anaerovorax sp. IOR16]|uniref:hypothetical protein n=1 Tax=Anaerovorax sp. IOR16 TaxID=2773458 RepID=UPI0019D1C2BB|nr:hypothetical protein [Anaerovorax sp. IOR16]
MRKIIYNDVLYGIVTKNSRGGMTADTYVKKDSAIKRSQEIIKHITENHIENMKVYLSRIGYDNHNNVMSGNLINDKSELLFIN